MATDFTANSTVIKAGQAISFLVLEDGKIIIDENPQSESVSLFNNPLNETTINEVCP